MPPPHLWHAHTYHMPKYKYACIRTMIYADVMCRYYMRISSNPAGIETNTWLAARDVSLVRLWH